MDAKQRKEVERLLKDAIVTTNKDIQGYREMTTPVETDDAVGRLSRMDAINNKSVTEAALRNAEEKLAGLEHALTQLDDTDFGKCARCSNEIPIQRIIFRPQSRLCVNCAR